MDYSSTALKVLFVLVALAAACNVPAWARLTWLAVEKRNVTLSVFLGRLGLFLVSSGLALGSYWRLGLLFINPPPARPIPLLVPFLSWDWPPLMFGKVMVPAASVGVWAILLLVGELALLVGSSIALLRERKSCPCLTAFVLIAPVVIGLLLVI